MEKKHKPIKLTAPLVPPAGHQDHITGTGAHKNKKAYTRKKKHRKKADDLCALV